MKNIYILCLDHGFAQNLENKGKRGEGGKEEKD